MMLRPSVARVALLSSLFACGDAERAGRGRVEDSAAGTVALGLDLPERYRETAVASAATLQGTIALAPGDTSVVPDLRGCQDSASVRPAGAADSGAVRALVWVSGIASGKPLPEVRRERVTLRDCQLSPRVVAVALGTTVNVFSADPAVHELRFFRENHGEPVAKLLTVDEGQVIPSERIAAEPGIVEARCARHPWARGFIAVFEHPYFAITDATGAFRIDSLPAGTYTVKVWHEGLAAPMERRIAVGPGGAGRLDLTLGSSPAPAAASGN